jgi:hypothetical protein
MDALYTLNRSFRRNINTHVTLEIQSTRPLSDEFYEKLDFLITQDIIKTTENDKATKHMMELEYDRFFKNDI